MSELDIILLPELTKPVGTLSLRMGAIMLVNIKGQRRVAMRTRAAFSYVEEGIVYLTGHLIGVLATPQNDPDFPTVALPLLDLVELAATDLDPSNDPVMPGAICHDGVEPFLAAGDFRGMSAGWIHLVAEKRGLVSAGSPSLVRAGKVAVVRRQSEVSMIRFG